MKRIKTVQNIVPESVNGDMRYMFNDLKKLFKDIENRKLISKATYTILYHPLLLLSKTYTVKPKGESYQMITLNTDHIILLSYLIGYVKEGLGSEGFWGSNATIAKDLGVCTRTIQRHLKDLADVGFIKTIMENESDRYIYVNYTRILTEILDFTDKEVNITHAAIACLTAVGCFVNLNLLEKTRIKELSQSLFNGFLKELCKTKITDPLEYFFKSLCNEFEVDFEDLKEQYAKVRAEHISKVVNAPAKALNESKCYELINQYLW